MSTNEVKVLIFSLNGEYYATDIMEIERILGFEEPTVLPDSPGFVEGVINYEGNILPIVSIAKKFNLPYNEDMQGSKIIVVKQDNSKVGMMVDVVSEVRDINLENVENPPEIAASISRRYIKGLIKLDKKIIIFLNLGSILTDEEKQMIV